MSAYFRAPRSAAYFSDPATYSNASPVFSVDSVSGGDQPGESWVFALSNASGSGMTANIGGTALTVTEQTSGSITVTIPDLLTFDGGIHRFSENLTVQIVDGASNGTIDTPITPATGFAQVQMPDPIAGVWASSTFEAAISPAVLAIGDYIHCTAPTDSDPENGIFPEDSTIVYRIMEMSDPTPVWGAEGTITIPAADDEAPVITLTGDATINLSEGDSYTEQGATWTDNIDGSGAATVGGDTVDTATPGTYTVTYNYTDAAGNAATQVTRTVNVANVNDSPTGSVTIDNTTPATGDTLTASNTLADEDGLGAITYQWYRGASPISGATSSTYSVVSADYGEALSVRASYTDQQGTPETVPSAATAAVTDGEAPVITLNGSATVTHAQGTAYNDAGATALDGVDGNLTGDIVTTGASFDTGTVGTYTVRYNVSDAAGNAATEVTRTVNVTDQTIPVITLTGGDVTLTEGGTYSEPGYTATDNNDGDISNSVVVAGDTVDPNTVGVYTVTYNVDDDAGNSAAQKTRTVTVQAAAVVDVDYIPQLLSTDSQEVTMFAGRGNRFKVTISHDGEAVDLSAFTRFELSGLTTELIDSSVSPSVFDISDGSGVIYIDSGSITEGDLITTSGTAKTILIGYTATETEGVVLWHPQLAQAHVTVNIIDA